MKGTLFVLALAVLLPVMLQAQATEGIQPEKIGKDSAQQDLAEVSVSKFEDVAFWAASMPLDDGLVTIRRFEGAPAGRKPLPGEEQAGIQAQDSYVLGAKIQFFKRGNSSVSIYPVRPLPIEGISKTISLWVVGRNYNHVLKVIIADYFNRPREITVGRLNFMGWKQLTAAIPPKITQDEYHFANQRGIKFLGIKIDFNLEESFGTYYVYFDDLRAITDLFADSYRDPDDMTDGW